MTTDTSPDTPCRPWLADDAQITLPKKLAKEALSHRRWPGEAVSNAKDVNRLNSLAHGLNRPYKKTVSFDYSDCSPEWQQVIAEALSLIDTELNTTLPPQVLAVLVALKNDNNPQGTQDLQDHIVEQGGLEYATEVVIVYSPRIRLWRRSGQLLAIKSASKLSAFVFRFRMATAEAPFSRG